MSLIASNRTVAAVSMFLGMFASDSACFAAPTISNIGTWASPGYPGFSSRADAINADGTAVAATIFNASPTTGPLACRWTNAGGLVTNSCGWYSSPKAITADGLQLAGTATVGGAPQYWATRWSPFNTCAVSLGNIAGQVNNGQPTDVVALGMTPNGSKIVGYGTVMGGAFGVFQVGRPFSWTSGGGQVQLPMLAGHVSAYARAISADTLTTVGLSAYQGGIGGSDFYYRACFWDAGGVHDMGWMAAGLSSDATAVSSDGLTIVGAADIVPTGFFNSYPGPVHAFRWQGSYQDLGLLALAGGNDWSRAQAVSANGEVVLGVGTVLGDQEAFIWRSDFGMAKLEDVLGWLGLDLTGWDLNEVTGISADSQSLCGNGTYGGQSVGWVIQGLPPLCGPLITTQPLSQTVCAGDSMTFFTTGFWGGPTATQWYRLYPVGPGLYIQFPINNGPQPGGSVVTGAYTQFMNISGATPSDEGLYAATVWSGCSAAQTEMVQLTVRTLPYFTTLPPLTTWMNIHGNLTLSVNVASAWGETPTFQWTRNNVPLVDGPTCGSTVSGAQTTTLTMTNCYGIDAGTYGINVTGLCGTIGAGAQVILCPADLDDGTNTGSPDGGVDINDLLYFLNEFSLGNPTTDLDNGLGFGEPDCGSDLNDLLYFLTVFSAGC